jgi:Domain of unknown function (DUF4159)
MKRIIFLLLIFSIAGVLFSAVPESSAKLARLKYGGGGDWYNDQSSEHNLMEYVKKRTNIQIDSRYQFVDISDDKLFEYPLIFLTGHGNINFSKEEARRLRAYLDNGGFLYIDDDYGLDRYIRKEMKKVFPSKEFEAVKSSHGIFSSHFKFSNGIPKIHEHDDKSPSAFAINQNGRMCVFYTYESNLADGWADSDVHKDSPIKREESLKMGMNIIVWALTN